MHTDKDRLSDARFQVFQYSMAGWGVPLGALLLVVSYLAITGTTVETANVKHVVVTLWLGGIAALSVTFIRAVLLRPRRRDDSEAAVFSRPAELFDTPPRSINPGQYVVPLLVIPTLVLAVVEAWNLYHGLHYHQPQWKTIILVTWGGTLLVVFAKILFAAFRRRPEI